MTLGKRVLRLEAKAGQAAAPLVVLHRFFSPSPSGPVSGGFQTAQAVGGPVVYRREDETEADFLARFSLTFPDGVISIFLDGDL